MMLGVIKTSYKENERTIPVYPEHSKGQKKELLEKMIFEVDSGIEYWYLNDHLKRLRCRLEDRDILFRTCDILLLPKPTEMDFMQMRDGQVL